MTPSDYAFVTEFLFQKTSIALEAGKEYLVESRLLPVAKRLGLASVTEFLQKVRQPGSSSLCNEIIEAMVTTETSFFRDIHPFETLRKTVLPELIQSRASERRLSIWCAASSSGQEPYTIAIILKEYFPELSNWNLRFQATDISQQILARAKEGRYSQLEVNRGLPAALLMKYFTQEGNQWQIRDDLRRMIDFQILNLSGPWPTMAPFDLIFIRNVMIYFDVETKKNILHKISRLLRSDGYLVLGGAETTFNLNDSYKRVENLKSGFYSLISNDSTLGKQK
jgi:chemotaxis protein methyltransferase CheR